MAQPTPITNEDHTQSLFGGESPNNPALAPHAGWSPLTVTFKPAKTVGCSLLTEQNESRLGGFWVPLR